MVYVADIKKYWLQKNIFAKIKSLSIQSMIRTKSKLNCSYLVL